MDPQQRAIAEEFDRYRESYDQAVNRAIAFSGQKVESFTRAKAHDLLRTVTSHFNSPGGLSLLDVGCGIGNYHPFLVPVVGAVTGVDVSSACIAKARERNPSVSYSAYDGDRLPYPDGKFDVTYCVCVLHHVPPDRWKQFVQEMCRVTRMGGLVVIYEHNPAHLLTRKVVHDCEFDRDAVANPLVGFYPTADGRFVSLMLFQDQRYWPDLCDHLGRPDLIDNARFATSAARYDNRRELIALLRELFRAAPLDAWRERLKTLKGVWAPVQTPLEVHDDPQAIANGYLRTLERADGARLAVPANPVQFDKAAPSVKAAPGHGEHTDEVLLELGLSYEEILAHKAEGAVL